MSTLNPLPTLPTSAPFGVVPQGQNPKYGWVQIDPSKNRDDVLQWFVSIKTGALVWGRTSGTMSDHIHLYNPNDNTDSGTNLDPVSGSITKDGSILTDIGEIAALVIVLMVSPSSFTMS